MVLSLPQYDEVLTKQLDALADEVQHLRHVGQAHEAVQRSPGGTTSAVWLAAVELDADVLQERRGPGHAGRR